MFYNCNNNVPNTCSDTKYLLVMLDLRISFRYLDIFQFSFKKYLFMIVQKLTMIWREGASCLIFEETEQCHLLIIEDELQFF